MTEPNFNQGLYDSTLEALKQNNVPESVAELAANVVATDDALLPDLGRTPEDQLAINEAMTYFWNQQNKK